jgi:nitrite reductase (NO-forming)
VARAALPVIEPTRGPGGRGVDRRITFWGLLVAALLLAVAVASAVGWATGGSLWLPLHFVLAGAASTAIAAMLPFFTTALAQVAPARPSLRVAGIGLIAGGSTLAAAGMTAGRSGSATLGGMAYVAGLLAVGAAAFLPLRASLGFRLRLVHAAYLAALGQVAVGVALATLLFAGWGPVAGAWAALKPAHAWLNLFGFVSLVVAASLVHLAPTVAGARIRPRRSAAVALVGLMSGVPLVALGMAGGLAIVARTGALVALLAGVALVVHAAAVRRDRGRWTTDSSWHRFTGLSLLAAPVWLLVALAVGAGRVIWLGSSPTAWSVELLAVPLAAGWVGQVLVGSWTHLVPAIGPGDPAAHAIQRRWLGRGAGPRWLAWNAGTLLATVGLWLGAGPLATLGGALLGAAVLAGLGLLIPAVGISSWRAPAAVAAARR